MNEHQIQAKVTNYAVSIGLISIRINVTGRRGWPDYGYIWRGRICFIEFKVPGARPEPLQAHVHGILERAWCPVLVIDDVGRGKKALDDWKDMIDANR